MKHVYERDFKYTPVREMGPNYLRDRFIEIRKQQAAQPSNVKPIVRAKIK